MEDFKEEAIFDATILVVDDDIQVTRLVERLLRREGYSNLILSNSSEEVLGLCEEYRPDLLILDLNMPGISGRHILRGLAAARTESVSLPVLVLSAEASLDQRLLAFELGALDFVAKPFDFEMLARVRSLLERHIFERNLLSQTKTLEGRIEESLSELREAHAETVRRLGLAAEYRDDETGRHVSRICTTTTILARAMGESEPAARLLGLAAKLHDIGKLGIPDSVLLKPGKLTDQEYELMKTHTTIGASILSNASCKVLKLAEQIALSHHEKWDGSGYPNGLKGEDIPLAARAVAVCDVFDALVSERSYKRAWSVEEALEYLREQSGRHFDPALVKLFVENVAAILGAHNSSAHGAAA